MSGFGLLLLIVACVIAGSLGVGFVATLGKAIGLALMVGTVLLGVLSLVGLALTVLAGLALLPFGYELMLTVLWLIVTVEPVPVGRWTIHQFGPDSDRGPIAGFQHSSPYEDPRVMSLIAGWMKEGAEG